MDFQLDKMCRICLKEGEDLVSIFFNDDLQSNQVSLPNRIMACASVQVVINDGLPELICSKCLVQVDVAYEFKEKCQSADATFRKYISLIGPFFSNPVPSNEPLLKDDEETINSFGGTDAIDSKFSESENIYDFQKEDSISNLGPTGSKIQDLNESDSDAPLIRRQNEYKKKKKGTEKTPECRSKKSKKIKSVCEEESVVSTSDNDKKKKVLKDDKDVKCPICKKTFAYLCILKDHMVQHTGAKPYLCSSCGKSFGHTASLTNHMKTHYSDKPHKCDRCELSFHRRAHLVLHMRTHTGEKPYVCDVCGRDFAQSSYLKEHMRVHSGEKPFICDICGHGFARKSCLVMHRRVHTGELPYACPECGRAFSQRSQRKRHVKRNHKGSACLRATGELILKDLDLKNKNSVQDEMSDNTILQRDSASVLQRQGTSSVNNSQFRELNMYHQESTSSLSSTTMPLPLIQIHRTLIE